MHRCWASKAISAENKVLFFNFQAICAGVSLVYLASTLVFTYLFKGKKKSPAMIYGLLQEHNFPCCAPNMRGRWKGHAGHTNTKALPWRAARIFISPRTGEKKCQVDLLWDSSPICKEHWTSQYLRGLCILQRCFHLYLLLPIIHSCGLALWDAEGFVSVCVRLLCLLCTALMVQRAVKTSIIRWRCLCQSVEPLCLMYVHTMMGLMAGNVDSSSIIGVWCYLAL